DLSGHQHPTHLGRPLRHGPTRRGPLHLTRGTTQGAGHRLPVGARPLECSRRPSPAQGTQASAASLSVPPALGSSLLTERNSSWETSTTSRESAASPEDFFSLIASPNMTWQNGHAVETVSGLVVSASSTGRQSV